MKTNITSSIKSKFSNSVHKLLERNINVKGNQRWKARLNQLPFTTEQKLALFDQINKLHEETSQELQSYFFNRREKKRIQKARIARGVKPKKRTSKAEYESKFVTI